MNPALLIAGAAAVLLLGGKKKTKAAAAKEPEGSGAERSDDDGGGADDDGGGADDDGGGADDGEPAATDTPPIISSETEAEVAEDAAGEASTDGEAATDDQSDSANTGAFQPTTVATGVRKDRLGHRRWRVRREADGYHAQILTGTNPHDRLSEDLGVSATIGPARTLLRDTFNARLLAKYPKELPQNEPPKWTSTHSTASTLKYTAGGGGGGGGQQGISE